MKKLYIAAVFIAVFVVGSSVSAVAQNAKAESDDIVRLAGRAERKLDNATFRVVLTTEWFTERDGEPFSKATETFAAVQPGKYQSITETGGTRIETIVSDGRTFRRTNEADWESVAVPPIKKAGNEAASAMFGDLAGGATVPAGTGKFISRGTIDGQEVSMYELRVTRSDNKKGGITRVDTTQYWINTQGLIVRKIIEQDIAGDKRFMRSIANYAYGDIDIDEPILPVVL